MSVMIAFCDLWQRASMRFNSANLYVYCAQSFGCVLNDCVWCPFMASTKPINSTVMVVDKIICSGVDIHLINSTVFTVYREGPVLFLFLSRILLKLIYGVSYTRPQSYSYGSI